MEKLYAPPKNWFQRNWKWFIPIGCLSSIVVVALFVTILFSGITSILKDSHVYKHTMTVTKENQLVIEKLGNNIQQDGTLIGSIATSNNRGNAILKIPLKGSKGSGFVQVIAQKENNAWIYTMMDFHEKGSGKTIDLLDANP